MSIFDRLKDVLDGDNNEQQPNTDVLPASQDPLGDPADQEGYASNAAYNNGYNQTGYNQAPVDESQFGNVLPASQDPLGDPADQEAGFGNVLPASQDPLGDPADQEAGQQEHHGGLRGVLENIFVRK